MESRTKRAVSAERMKSAIRRVIDLGVRQDMDPEEAKYVQMSNMGALLMTAVNLPYLALCIVYGWWLLVAELCAVNALLCLTIPINRRGLHGLAFFYFGFLLNVHLVFASVALGRETLLPLLIFFTAGGAILMIRRKRKPLLFAALAGILLTYQIAMLLSLRLGPLLRLEPGQKAVLELFVTYSVFSVTVVNAFIGRFGANGAEDRLREEQRRSERLLATVREQERLKTRFFQNVSHELRTPLTLILGPLEDLSAGSEGALENGLRRKLAMIQRNAMSLLPMVDQMLDLSRIDEGAVKLKASRGDLGGLLETLVASFADHAAKKGISVALERTSGDSDWLFDRQIVEKIVGNLLFNSCKFTPSGGRVTVRVAPDPERGAMRLSVSDTGIGIPQGDLERVFDRFYQAEGPAGAAGGAGIGLSLVKDLVRIHGGEIRVESAQGKGSEFTVLLPRRPASAEDTAATAGPPDPPPARDPQYPEAPEVPAPFPPDDGTTILVVEDDADMREYLRMGLEPHFRVIEARDAAEGLKRTREEEPRLVVSDVMMPGMDGFAFCRSLHGEAALSRIPVILLTARASPDTVIEGLEAGAVDCITKPFSFEILLARIRSVLQRESALEKAALRDGQTGLLNRAVWEREAGLELRRMARRGGAASLLFLDLDDFKRINDTQGHQAGDRVLIALAKTLVRQLRTTDLVGRYGGEEFVALLSDSPREAAVRSMERILELFREGSSRGEGLRCTFSAGVAEIAGAHPPDLAEAIARADSAMYGAKMQGKNRVLPWRRPAEG